MDRVGLRNLRIPAYIGVGDDERSRPQDLELDIDLEVDVRRATRSDDVVDTIDYMDVAERVRAVVGAAPVHLLETLAGQIADDLLSRYRAGRAVVAVRKRAAALPGPDAVATVTVTRP